MATKDKSIAEAAYEFSANVQDRGDAISYVVDMEQVESVDVKEVNGGCILTAIVVGPGGDKGGKIRLVFVKKISKTNCEVDYRLAVNGATYISVGGNHTDDATRAVCRAFNDAWNYYYKLQYYRDEEARRTEQSEAFGAAKELFGNV